jgi:hypothetical protein
MENEMGRAYRTHGRSDTCMKIFGHKTKKNISLERPICRLEDNIKIGPQGRFENMNWMQFALERAHSVKRDKQ